MKIKKKEQNKKSLGSKIKNFFFPKNFGAEVTRGMYKSSPYGCGNVLFSALFGLGKLVRKVVDPQHKIKIRKEKK